MRELYAAALALRAELAGAEASAQADGRRLTVRRGPYRIARQLRRRAVAARRASPC